MGSSVSTCHREHDGDEWNGSDLPVTLPPLRANGWLHDMKLSSPTAIRVKNGSSSALFDPTYRAWTKKYPSALNVFEKIVSKARGKKIALFLDYDGTLSPIVDEPDNAVMSDQMREVVRNAAMYFPTAIISGRSCDKVFAFVKLTELYYAGSHGMDIRGPLGKSDNDTDSGSFTNSTKTEVHIIALRESAKMHGVTTIQRTKENEKTTYTQTTKIKASRLEGKEVIFQTASEFIPIIDEVFRLLVDKTEGIWGAKVESNKFCVSVHYRNVDERDWPLIAQCTDDVLQMYPRLRMSHGRKVLEIRPVIDWDKGKAVQFLLDSLGLAGSDHVLPIYIGDDRTDEDAFKVLRDGKRGIGILVSSMPKESHALYSLIDPSEVLDFLKRLVTWKNQEALTNK